MALTNPITTGTGAGGELLSPEVSAPIIAGIASESAILQVAPQQPVTTNQVKVPVITAVDDPEFVEELTAKPNGGADFSKSEINVRKIAQIITLSEEIVEDALADPATYLDEVVRKKIAQKIDAHALGFYNGSAVTSKFDAKLSSTTASATVDATADYATAISNAMEMLEGNGYTGTHAILSPTFKAAFRNARNTQGTPLYTPGFTGAPDTFYDLSLAYSRNLQPLSGKTNVVGYVVDAEMLKLAVRTQVEVRVTREATVGGVSLFESNGIGLLYEQRIGFNAFDLNRAVVKLVTKA